MRFLWGWFTLSPSLRLSEAKALRRSTLFRYIPSILWLLVFSSSHISSLDCWLVLKCVWICASGIKHVVLCQALNRTDRLRPPPLPRIRQAPGDGELAIATVRTAAVPDSILTDTGNVGFDAYRIYEGWCLLVLYIFFAALLLWGLIRTGERWFLVCSRRPYLLGRSPLPRTDADRAPANFMASKRPSMRTESEVLGPGLPGCRFNTSTTSRSPLKALSKATEGARHLMHGGSHRAAQRSTAGERSTAPVVTVHWYLCSLIASGLTNCGYPFAVILAPSTGDSSYHGYLLEVICGFGKRAQ